MTGPFALLPNITRLLATGKIKRVDVPQNSCATARYKKDELGVHVENVWALYAGFPILRRPTFRISLHTQQLATYCDKSHPLYIFIVRPGWSHRESN